MECATELEWLQYFYQNVDLGPADSDIVCMLKEEFVEHTGKQLPIGYGKEE